MQELKRYGWSPDERALRAALAIFDVELEAHSECAGGERDNELAGEHARRDLVLRLLRRVDFATTWGLLRDELASALGLDEGKVRSCLASFEARCGRLGIENFIAFSHELACAQFPDEEAAVALFETLPARNRFRYPAEHETAREALVHYVETRINAIFVRQAVAAFAAVRHDASVAGEDASCMRSKLMTIRDYILLKHRTRVAPVYHGRLEEEVRRLLGEAPKRPVVVVSIGCGDGRDDVLTMESIRHKLGLSRSSLMLLGVDPHASLENNHIARNDVLIRTAVPPDSAIVDFAQAHVKPPPTGGAAPTYLVLAKYSVHHIGGQTPKAFLHACRGAGSVVLLEEPTTWAEMRDPLKRLGRIAYDLLANCAFNEAWAAVFLEDPDAFDVSYLWREHLQEIGVRIESIPELSPDTAVLSWSPAEADVRGRPCRQRPAPIVRGARHDAYATGTDVAHGA